jgi:hypothetical protein
MTQKPGAIRLPLAIDHVSHCSNSETFPHGGADAALARDRNVAIAPRSSPIRAATSL